MVRLTISVLAVLMVASAAVWAEGWVTSVGEPDQRFSLYKVQAVEINANSLHTAGAVWWDPALVAAELRQAASGNGFCRITVSGQEFKLATATQDRVANSGRYKPSSQQLVQSGKMIAPTRVFIPTIVASWETPTSTVGFSRAGASVKRGVAQVEVMLEQYDIQTGVCVAVYTGKGEASEIIDAHLATRKGGVGHNNNDVALASRLLVAALQEAISKAIVSLTESLTQNAEIIGINVPCGTIFHLGDEITFSRDGEKIATYEVLAINGERLGVRELGATMQPGMGDSFKIAR